MAKSSFIARIFDRKPRLDHPVAAKRLIALAELNSSDEEDFVRVALNDEDEAVKRAALDRIQSTNRLAVFLDDDLLQDTVTERICSDIDLSHELMCHERVRERMLAQVNDGVQLGEYAKQLKSNNEVANAIFLGQSVEIRQDAINQIGSNEVLNLCERISRSKDKTLNRYIRDRLAERKKLAADAGEQLTRAEQLIESATRADSNGANYDSLRDAQEQSWEQLLESIQDLNKELVGLKLDALNVAALRARFPERTQTKSSEVHVGKSFSQILRDLKKSTPSDEVIETAEREWLEALRKDAPPVELSNEFFDLLSQVRKNTKTRQTELELLPKLQSLTSESKPTRPDLEVKGGWSKLWKVKREARDLSRRCGRFLKNSDFGDLPAETKEQWTKSVEETIEHCQELVDFADEQFDDTMDKISKRVDDLKVKIDEGATVEAKYMEREIRNLINRLPSEARRRPADKLGPVSAELHDLLTWKQFATQPRRSELLGQIQKLRDQPLEPEQQHEQIRSLRIAWNSLGPPMTADEIQLRKEYDEAADAAFKICEAWFEAKRAERIRNTELKERLAVELEKVLENTDWDSAEWDLVSKQLHARRLQFEEIRNVDRARNRGVNKRFYKTFSAIRDKVTKHRESIRDKKKEIIAKAQEVANDETIDQQEQGKRIKKLQNEWRNAGATFYKDEEALWQEFRGICDVIFQSRQLAYEKRKEGIDSNITEGNKLVDALLKRTKKDAQSIDPSELETVKGQVTELYLPKRIQHALDKKLKQVADLLAGKKLAVQQLATRERFTLLLKCDEELAGYETSNSPIPEEWFDAVQTDSVLFETRVPIEDETHRLEILDTVLKAEIKADLPAQNEEEEERRLQVKVRDLSKAMGRNEENLAEVAEELIGAWVGLAHGESEYRERFNKAIDQILNRAGI